MRILLLATVLVVGEMSDRTYEQPEDAQPVTVTPSALLDAWGDPRFLDVDDPSQDTTWGYQAASIGPAFSTLLTHGVTNADFAQGPPRPADPIGDDNPLPGWRYVVEQGGGFAAYWVDDSGSTSGKALRFRMTDPAMDDRAYIEQIVPVSPGIVAWPRFRWDTTQQVPQDYHNYQRGVTALAYDGTALGSELVSSGPLTTLLSDSYQRPVALPSGTRYVRLRYGMWADSLFSPDPGTSIAHLRSVALRRDESTTTFVGSRASALTGTGTSAIYVVSAGSDGTPASAAEHFIAPAAGYVQAISVRLSTSRTAGTLALQVRDTTAGTNIGPTATINATDTDSAWSNADSAHVAVAQQFVRGAVLRFVATGTSFTPTGADVLVHATIAYVPPEAD